MIDEDEDDKEDDGDKDEDEDDKEDDEVKDEDEDDKEDEDSHDDDGTDKPTQETAHGLDIIIADSTSEEEGEQEEVMCFMYGSLMLFLVVLVTIDTH
jgi:hypothetical protein